VVGVPTTIDPVVADRRVVGERLLRRGSEPIGWLVSRAVMAIIVLISAFVSRHYPPAQSTFGDIRVVYYPAHLALWRGLLPYRGFLYEYPPLTLVSVLLPPFAGTVAVFVIGWLLQMLVLDWLVFRGLSRLGRDGDQDGPCWPVLVWIAAGVLLAGLGLLRNDLIVCAPVVWAFVYLREGRPFWCGVLLGMGILAKAWPILIVAAAVVFLGARGASRMLAGVALTASVAVAVLSGTGLLGPSLRTMIDYHGARSLEIEALAARPFQIVGAVDGRAPRLSDDHGSVNLTGHVELGSVLTIAGLAVVVVILAIAACDVARRGVDHSGGPLARSAALSTLLLAVTLCFARVFSPQYLLWLVALAAVAAALGGIGSRELVLVIVLTVLTTAIFPASWNGLVAAAPWAVCIATARDLVLVALLIAVASRARHPHFGCTLLTAAP
jgi:hypothetical protein